MSKIILHIDMNSYFAMMEQQAYPNLRGKPIGIAGKGRGERTVMVGASIEAKRMGVRGAMAVWEAKKICPEIIIIPANYDRYIYTSQRIFSLLERFSHNVEIFSIDEAFIELRPNASWADATALAKQIKQLVKKQIGEWVTCSIGISYGKTLAKLASELQKPDGLVVIRPEDFFAIADKTPIEELCGIGYRIRPRLNQLGVRTIAELGNLPKEMLIKVFGEHTGLWLHRIGNGHDDNKLRAFYDLPQEKSVGHSYTLPRDVTSLDDAKKVLLLLAERVGVRLRRKGLIGKTVSIYIRFYDKTGWSERKTQKEYILDGYSIYKAGERLLEKLPYNKPVRLVSISISDLAKQSEVTQPLFLERHHYEQLVEALDKINARYGEFTVYRGLLSKVRERVLHLPDGRNKRLYNPQGNPFVKRLS